jgi:hypothetical protein
MMMENFGAVLEAGRRAHYIAGIERRHLPALTYGPPLPDHEPMRNAILLTGLILMGAAVACGAPAPRPAPEPGPMPVARPPVYALLGYRDQLQLTSAQIASLDSIGRSLESQNRPILDRLAGVRRGVEPPRDEQEYRALVEQVYANNRAGQDAVRGVLNETQRTRTCELFRPSPDEQRRAERRNNSRMQETRRSRRGMVQDTLAFTGSGVWTWCAAAPQPPATRRR